MRCSLLLFCLFAAIFQAKSSKAQTLTQILIAEDAAKLVQQARDKGDIVRGAILFHQGNLNCARCHRPASETQRIGPVLSNLGDDVTDVSLVESILDPSKSITKGFETVTILSVDGELFDGTVTSENDQSVTIRDREDVDKLVTVLRDDIDEIKPGKLSSMPANLADELKNRKQFLDLLRYVIDVKERGPGSIINEPTQTLTHRLESELEGLVSIKKYNCTACHSESQTFAESMTTGQAAPNLKWSARHLNPNYLQSFIANPHAVDPKTSMPDLFGALNLPVRKRSAAAITNYLISQANNEFKLETLDSDAAQRGYSVFHSVGCVACHNPRDNNSVETLLADSIDMGPLSGKYNVDSMVRFLEDPLAVRASGHMPNMNLTHREAIDIANFLLQETAQTEFSVPFETNVGLIERGKELFEQMNCNACHQGFDSKWSEVPEFASINKLDLNKGCLSAEPGPWPLFPFAKGEVADIRAGVSKSGQSFTPEQQIRVALRSYNCIACHSRDELGGVTNARNPHFTTTNLNLGDQGRIPPTLTGVGAKLKPQWMRDVFVNRRSIRPYMNTRMPQYGENNIGHLIDLLQTADQLGISTEFAKFKDQKEMRQWGLELAGNKGLNCVACHTYKFKISDTMPAVDLTEMTQRLKKDWFYQYMLNPQRFSPNTVMPSFWPAGKAIRPDIEGMPSFQIEALWQYLIDGRQARAPRGVVREPLEIVVKDEAKMLRRKYPNIGKRGIGVGYPDGVNLAYDAEQMRLAMVWKGKFVDPGGVWTGQGSGQVRPMGPTINFDKGPDLDFAEEPWVVDDGRPPLHRFKGYRLDERQRPTFLYEIDGIKVEDYFVELPPNGDSQIGLTRTIKIFADQKAPRLLRMRLAGGNVQQNENRFTCDGQLTIEIKSEHGIDVVLDGDQTNLQITVATTPDQDQTLEIEYRWK